MRILALDHGTKRIGVAVSDETKTIALPLEYIPAEPFAPFLERLKKILTEKEIDLILIGHPRNMDGSYGPAAQKVETFVGVLRSAGRQSATNSMSCNIARILSGSSFSMRVPSMCQPSSSLMSSLQSSIIFV